MQLLDRFESSNLFPPLPLPPSSRFRDTNGRRHRGLTPVKIVARKLANPRTCAVRSFGKFVDRAAAFERRLGFSLRIPVKVYGRGLVCIRNDSRAPSSRESLLILEPRHLSAARSVLSSLLPLFWLTVAPCRAYGGRFVESNDVPSSGMEESFLVRGEIYIYIYIFILFVKFIGGEKHRIVFEIRSSSRDCCRLFSCRFTIRENNGQ